MIMVAPILGAAAISGVANWWGQRSANTRNRKEARINRDFQERMRNTSWQAGVKDMEAAGINPALAYSQGGASSPSGSVAASQENEAGKGVEGASNAMAVREIAERTKLLRQQREKATSEADFARASNMAYGITRTASGQLKLDLEMPGLAKLIAAQVSSAQSSAALANMRIPEQEALADLFKQFGQGGKGAQLALPLIISLLRGR